MYKKFLTIGVREGMDKKVNTPPAQDLKTLVNPESVSDKQVLNW